MFRFVDIGAYGRRSDGGIFSSCTMGRKFETSRMNVPQSRAVCEGGPVLPYCLVGDEAFPLKPYMLRPYPGKNGLTKEQHIFNFRLSHARRMIENTFGILASQWRILRKPIIANVDNVMKMVQAIICLHNWLREDDFGKDVYIAPHLIDRDENNEFRPGSWRGIVEAGCALQDITHCGTNTSTRESIRIRNAFKDYFNNDGAVSWQENH